MTTQFVKIIAGEHIGKTGEYTGKTGGITDGVYHISLYDGSTLHLSYDQLKQTVTPMPDLTKETPNSL